MKIMLRIILVTLFLVSCGHEEDIAFVQSKPSPNNSTDQMTNEASSDCLIAGTIRYDRHTADWHVVNDDTHRSIGIASVSATERGVMVVYDCSKMDFVVTFIATTDETYAKHGVFVGSSVGLDRAFVEVNTGDKSLDSEDFETANIWIYGLMQ